MKELIKDYLELEQQMRAKTDEIKAAAKKEAMETVSNYLANGQGDEAKKVIDRLDKLGKLKLVMNIADIIEFVGQMSNVEIPQALQVSKGQEIKFESFNNEEDLKKLMELRGYTFLNKVPDGAMRFEKEKEYYFLYLAKNAETIVRLQKELKEALKYCNLVYIVRTEEDQELFVSSITKWLIENTDEAIRKYLKVQVGSIQKMQQAGSILEIVNL